jgi:hypothetical protein
MAIGFGVTFDCREPERLAEFWRALLGYEDLPVPEGFSSWEEHDRAEGVPESELDARSAAFDPERIGARLFFQRVPEPKTVKNRLHLDVAVGAGLHGDEHRARLDVERTRAERLGATFLRPSEDPDDYYLVMLDPEGNEFCLT